MEENLFLSSYNESSKRHAVLEDDGLTIWLYLHKPSDDPGNTASIESDIYVHNRQEPIEKSDVKSYQSSPPPIAKDYASNDAICTQPMHHDWKFNWSTNGGSVVLLKNGIPWCLITEEQKMGYSKSIKKQGPWGNPWDQEKYKSIS